MRKTKQDGVYFFWSASIIVCMLLSLFAVGYASFSKGPASGYSPSADTSGTLTSPSSNGATVLSETSDMGQEYVDKFTFLGDSTTYGLGFYKVVNTSQVWTPENGTLTLSLWSTSTIVYEDSSQITIEQALTKKQPEYMLITLGVNGVALMDEEYFKSEYTKLVQTVQQVSPNTKIILNSIYPISASYDTSKGISNEKIDAANKWIESIAETTNVKYLDSESVLKNSDGTLNDTYQNGDGLHLNADGYQHVINYLRTHGYQ